MSLCACHYNFEDCDFISYLQVAMIKKCIYLYINKHNISVAIWQRVGGSHILNAQVCLFFYFPFSFQRHSASHLKQSLCDGRSNPVMGDGIGEQKESLQFRAKQAEDVEMLGLMPSQMRFLIFPEACLHKSLLCYCFALPFSTARMC